MSISTQNNTHGKETPNVTAGEISAISSAEITESVILNVEATDCSVVGQQGLNVNNNASKTVGAGWKIAFDNIDIFQRVRDMTQDNQNKNYHWVNHVKVTNRVSGNHLPDDKPICDSVCDLDNYKVLPTVPQYMSHKGNYILLIERVITEQIPCLSFCRDVVTWHIPHPHSIEMATKSEKASHRQLIIAILILYHDDIIAIRCTKYSKAMSPARRFNG